jgi:hypothetical protein
VNVAKSRARLARPIKREPLQHYRVLLKCNNENADLNQKLSKLFG